MARTVLVIDDELSIRESVKLILEYDKYQVDTAENGIAGIRRFADKKYDVVLLDIKMPGMDGMEVLQKLRADNTETPIIMISGHGTAENAVQAVRMGALDFLSKPLDRDRLLITVKNAIQASSLAVENKGLKAQIETDQRLLGDAPVMAKIREVIARVGPTDARVLITGENGTGKELVAKHIHRSSKRSSGPLVEVNCAAIPSELIESELFGHEKGAFTGASAQRIGKFEQADGGTLFLDEIGDMSLQAQAKVLRALQENRIERVGGNKSIPVDVRVIAATNKNLLQQIEDGQFREDLYHRLSVILIHVPPLRERRDDVSILSDAFLAEICLRSGQPAKTMTSGAGDRMKALDWRGNVRELHNVVERLVIMSSGAEITKDDVELFAVPPGAAPRKPTAASSSADIFDEHDNFQAFKESAERQFIQRQLEKNGWNISRTAESLDIQRSHLYNKMDKYGLKRGDASANGGDDD